MFNLQKTDFLKHPFFILSFPALMFGFWFASMQLHVISPQAFYTYPVQYFALTILKCYLTIAVFFAASQLILSHLSAGKINPSHIAWTFFPLIFVYQHCPLYLIAAFIAGSQLGLLTLTLNKNDYQRIISQYGVDTGVLLFLLVSHLLLTSALSPLHWNMPLLTMDAFNGEEVPVVVPLFKGFVLAKQFSFANVDHSQWAGIMHPAVSLTSPFMQLAAFILDLPSVSYDAFHILVLATYFIMMVLGSFGFYLFLKYALKVHLIFAILGGFLFYFSGAPLLHLSFQSDTGIFISAHACFPYALLLISLAFEKNSWRLAALAGLAMTAQFFFFAPHPEATIYLFLFYGIFTLGLCLFSREVSWFDRLRLAAISYFVFAALSAFYITPIMIDRFTGNMYAFAHVRDISFTYMKFFSAYIRLIVIFGPLSFLLLYVYKRLSPVYLSSLLLAVTLGIFVSLTTHQSFNVGVVHLLNLGLHIWVPMRPGVYFYAASFIIAMAGLDILTHAIRDLINDKYLPFLEKKR